MVSIGLVLLLGLTWNACIISCAVQAPIEQHVSTGFVVQHLVSRIITILLRI